MENNLLKLLRSVDTPTVCNAIEVAQGKRGFKAFTRGTMYASDLTGVIVGYAVTAQIAAVAPPSEDPRHHPHSSHGVLPCDVRRAQAVGRCG